MIGPPPNNRLYYIQNGSYLQFQVLATYDQIQEQLGKPNIDDDMSKVNFQTMNTIRILSYTILCYINTILY